MPLYYSNFKSFSNKISRIFWFEQLYVWPLLAILKGQYRPWAELGRPVQGWYWWISTLWCHRKLPHAEHWIPGLLKQIMATLMVGNIMSKNNDWCSADTLTPTFYQSFSPTLVTTGMNRVWYSTSLSWMNLWIFYPHGGGVKYRNKTHFSNGIDCPAQYY